MSNDPSTDLVKIAHTGCPTKCPQPNICTNGNLGLQRTISYLIASAMR